MRIRYGATTAVESRHHFLFGAVCFIIAFALIWKFITMMNEPKPAPLVYEFFVPPEAQVLSLDGHESFRVERKAMATLIFVPYAEFADKGEYAAFRYGTVRYDTSKKRLEYWLNDGHGAWLESSRPLDGFASWTFKSVAWPAGRGKLLYEPIRDEIFLSCVMGLAAALIILGALLIGKAVRLSSATSHTA